MTVIPTAHGPFSFEAISLTLLQKPTNTWGSDIQVENYSVLTWLFTLQPAFQINKLATC